MKSSEQSLKNAANTIFAKFVVKLASTEPVTAAVITAAAGGLILAAGGYQELADTTTLLTQAGPDALAAYQATTPKTITQILGRALAGDLPSWGLATMGTGIWTVLTAPPVAYAVAKFAKGLNFVKEMTEKVERAERPRGATRLAADLDAIDNHYRQPENKGPSPRGLR